LGFWHTGYFEFHEPDEPFVPRLPPRPSHVCSECGAAFFSERDLDVHQFSGHVRQRPTLILKGREVGRTRLYVTKETNADEWDFRSAESVTLNGDWFSPGAASRFLSSRSTGFADVVARNGDERQEYQFEFALADATDLEGVDDALLSLFRGSVLGHDSIDTFIMRGKRYSSASRYLDGIANHLYGVVAREDHSDVNADPEKYESGTARIGLRPHRAG
jgi:hypothetical protein